MTDAPRHEMPSYFTLARIAEERFPEVESERHDELAEDGVREGMDESRFAEFVDFIAADWRAQYGGLNLPPRDPNALSRSPMLRRNRRPADC